MIIFDELAYAKDLLEHGPKKFMATRDMLILAKYFRHIKEMGSEQIEKSLIDFCYQYEPEFNEIRQMSKIDYAVRQSDKSLLRIPTDIPITRNELEKIRTLKNYRYEKILFTMLVLGKHYKLTNTRMNKSLSKQYFINNKDSEIYRLAHTSKKKDENIFHFLYKNGFIDNNLRYNSYFLTFTDMDDDSEIVLFVNNMNKIIEFYKATCVNCGIEIERTGRSQKMCANCWKDINKTQTRNRVKKYSSPKNIVTVLD